MYTYSGAISKWWWIELFHFHILPHSSNDCESQSTYVRVYLKLFESEKDLGGMDSGYRPR